MMAILNSGSKTKCLVCGSKLKTELQNLFDTRFGIEGKYEVLRCEACGIEQIMPLPSSENLKNLYDIYYNFGGEKGTVYTRLRERLFLSILYGFWLAIDGDISFHSQKGTGRLLDVGCNEGRGLQIYKQNGFDAEGLELNKRAAAEARNHGLKVHAKSIEEFQPEKSYDVAVLSNVLEHSLQPKDMLIHIARILKPGGKVWISCPNNQSWMRYFFGRYWINWHVPFHIIHFSEEVLRNLLLDAGFKIIEVKYKTPALWFAHSIISRLFAKQGQPTNQLRNPFVIAVLMILIRTIFFPILWLGNRLGHGDCLIVVATKV